MDAIWQGFTETEMASGMGNPDAGPCGQATTTTS
jgi:hypothetical protein